jgi:serine/threonine-protein kinase
MDPSASNSRRVVRIGKYDVLTHIATGGMGAVYKAHDTELHRDVALKVLSPEMADRAAMVERFRREARSAAKLRHDNIVELFEFGEAGGVLYLAMEFVNGIDLHAYVTQKGKLKESRALRIILQACRALDYLHSCGFIHRDIKPSNFLIERRDGHRLVKLTDMGLARELEKDEARVTRAGTTVGTLEYMSPEQARDSWSADIRSDLYSLGATWFFLLTGRTLFSEGGLGERLLKILTEPAPDVRKINSDISQPTAKIIRRLLAKDPDKRFQTPAELLNELTLLQTGMATVTLEETPTADEEAPAQKQWQASEPAPPPRVEPAAPAATDPAARSQPTVEDRPAPVRRRKRRRRQRHSPLLWLMIGIACGMLLLGVLLILIALRS